VEAVQHAQAAQAATIHELLAGFPAGAAAADPELATVAAADELARLEEAEDWIQRAERADFRARGHAGQRRSRHQNES
jgi:hypothetical protein